MPRQACIRAGLHRTEEDSYVARQIRKRLKYASWIASCAKLRPAGDSRVATGREGARERHRGRAGDGFTRD